MSGGEVTALSTQVSQLHTTVGGLQASVGKLERAVDGDASIGVSPLRDHVKSLADDLRNEADALCDRLDKLERAAEVQESYLKGVMTVVKWLGGGTLVGLIGLIGTLAGVFGGGK